MADNAFHNRTDFERVACGFGILCGTSHIGKSVSSIHSDLERYIMIRHYAYNFNDGKREEKRREKELQKLEPGDVTPAGGVVVSTTFIPGAGTTVRLHYENSKIFAAVTVTKLSIMVFCKDKGGNSYGT